jgi:hypothetical protein
MADPLSTSLVATRVGSAAAGSALAYGALWLCLRNLGQTGVKAWIFWVPLTLFLVTMSALCWWFTLSGHHPESRAAIRESWRGGWLVGGVSLAVGFVGPLVVWPGATLGPLLGILLTGPVGFALGALGAVWLRKGRALG